MSTSNFGVGYSYEDYKSLSASSDQRFELIDGDLYMTPSPSVRHQTIVKNLAYLLESHTRATRCGRVFLAPLDVVLGRGGKRSVVQPDILFVSLRHAGVLTDEIVGPPDLVVEVLSSGTSVRDRGTKKALYAQSGVREYWIVDPDSESVEIFRLAEAGYREASAIEGADRLVSAAVPGFEVDVAEVFRDLP